MVNICKANCVDCFSRIKCFSALSSVSCFPSSYDAMAKTIYFITQLIIVCFTTVLLISGQQVFGIQLTFLSLRYNKYVSESFRFLTLLLSALANFIASNEHTTYCLNAIYSIVLLFVVIAHGTIYIHNQRVLTTKSTTKPQKTKKQGDCSTFLVTLCTYLLLAIIITADWLYYNVNNKEWFLLTCFVVFLPLWKQIKIPIYLFGFIINILIGASLYDWIVYSVFVVLLIGTQQLRYYEAKKNAATEDPKNKDFIY
jgi:hypothetical protein